MYQLVTRHTLLGSPDRQERFARAQEPKQKADQ
jgi:hypothetical protein